MMSDKHLLFTALGMDFVSGKAVASLPFSFSSDNGIYSGV